MTSNASFSIVCFIGICLFSTTHAVDVETKLGRLLGVTETIDGRNVDKYLGIPYSRPRMGITRFTDPIKPDPFIGVYNATEAKFDCYRYPDPMYQNLASEDRFSEDCLYLNIYVPTPVTRNTAVMVWIPGNDFRSGGGHNDYDGEQLALNGDMIVVTFEYRLWVFGFLSTNDGHAKGNYGLKDQNMALRWVKDNIAAFGGSPERITIVGSSSGAVSVGLHSISSMSKGLFNRAIMQSAAASAPWALNKDPYKSTVLLARSNGCAPPENVTTDVNMLDIMDCLRRKPADELIKESKDVVESQDSVQKSLNLIWTPVVDGDFLRDTPENLMKNLQHMVDVGFYSYDILLGINSWEGMSLIIKLPESIEKYLTSAMEATGIDRALVADGIVPTLLEHRYRKVNDISKRSILIRYTNGLEDDIDELVDFPDAYRLYGDAWYNVPVIQTAKTHAMTTSAGRTYLYMFDYKTSLGIPLDLIGSTHLQELPFLFSFGPKSNSLIPTENERALSTTMVTYWRNFIHNGNPNTPATDATTINWPAYDLDSQQYLILSNNMSSQDSSVGQRLFEERVDFWTDYLDEVNNAYDNIDRICSNTKVITVEKIVHVTNTKDDVTESNHVTTSTDVDQTDRPVSSDSSGESVTNERKNCPSTDSANANTNKQDKSQTVAQPESEGSNGAVIALGVTTGLFAITTIFLACFLCTRHRQTKV